LLLLAAFPGPSWTGGDFFSLNALRTPAFAGGPTEEGAGIREAAAHAFSRRASVRALTGGTGAIGEGAA
jgi:hypothetical protein